MGRVVNLIVEKGLDRGREIAVPAEGIRIGRSSRNDVVLNDSGTSKFHCRFFFKPGEGLWVTDLASSNGTLLNGVSIQEARVPVGGEVVIGDTVIRVVDERAPGETVVPPAGEPAIPAPADVDLGLSRAPVAKKAPPPMRRYLLILTAVMVCAAVAAWVPWRGLYGRLNALVSPPPPPPPPVVNTPLPVALAFERVEATGSNIFRYSFEVVNNQLVVQVDDLAHDRHVRREKKLGQEPMEELCRSIESAGFFDLLDDYSGIAPGVYESSDLSVTVGTRTRRVRVLNRVEPEPFAMARTRIEEFGKNEVGLAALATEPKELVAKANESFLLGCKLYDEREIRFENLSLAIRSFRDVEWCLETIEPKPDFYGDALRRQKDCEQELQKRYDDLWFSAERAVKLRDWQEAAKYLRIIRDMIPDRSDDRHLNAYKKLVDVERRLESETR
jgi:hypothetical protein